MSETLPTSRIGATDVEVTRLGLGTTSLANMYAAIDDATASATLDAARAAGITYFDTAPAYGSGLAEQRLGAWLAGRPRTGLTISTKVGNVLRPATAEELAAGSLFAEAPPLVPTKDFSRDAVLRTLDESLARLQADRVDMVAIHDPDDAASIEPGADPYARSHFRAAMDEAFPALDELRAQGVIGAIGVGMNGWQMLRDFAQAGDFDYFLLAGRHTLLEQEAARELFPLCRERGISVVVGGPYSSGVLATGAVEGARYNYAPAPPDILDRVARIERLCAEHDVPLRAAALQFCAAHPVVASVIPGAQTPAEVAENVELFTREIPEGLWTALADAGLVDAAATPV